MARSSSIRPICIGLGLCALDYIFQVESYPKLDDKIDALDFSCQGGGPVPTALCALSKFGVTTSFIGKCGSDHDGKLIAEELVKFGVGIEGLLIDGNTRTPRAFIVVERKSGKRTVILDRTETAAIMPDQINIDLIKSAKYLLIDGREAATARAAAIVCKNSGGEVVLDAGSPRKDIDTILPYVDHLVVSERFSSDFTKESDNEKAILMLAIRGFKSVVITSGPDGCVAANLKGEIFRQKAFEVEVVDTTGAGDVFHGAYIYGLIKNWELPKILKFASATAALKCQWLGGRNGIPELKAVESFLAKCQK